MNERILWSVATIAANTLLNTLLVKSFDRGSLRSVLIIRMVSAYLMTLTIVFLFDARAMWVDDQHAWQTFFYSLIFSAAGILINRFRKRNETDYALYPHVKNVTWSPGIIFWNVLSWMCYLLPYEYLFRGMLLPLCLAVMPLWMAVLVNAFVYALAHTPQGWRETYSSFCFGLLLCALTLLTDNFWCAFFIHLSLALSNDYFTLQRKVKIHLERSNP